MTPEEAINRLDTLKDCAEVTVLIKDKDVETFNLAIKALETGEIYITGEDYNLYMEGYKAGKKDFEQKQGEWIFHKDFHESCRYGCNQCGNLNNIPHNFCPNCGAKMKGSEKNGM